MTIASLDAWLHRNHARIINICIVGVVAALLLGERLPAFQPGWFVLLGICSAVALVAYLREQRIEFRRAEGEPAIETQTQENDALRLDEQLQVLVVSSDWFPLTSTEGELNHWCHHRGQLAYFRRLNVPVPSIYGPESPHADLKRGNRFTTVLRKNMFYAAASSGKTRGLSLRGWDVLNDVVSVQRETSHVTERQKMFEWDDLLVPPEVIH